MEDMMSDREQELERLMREQRADMAEGNRQAPQRFGAAGSEPVLSIEAALPHYVTGDLEGESVPDTGNASDGSPHIVGRFKQSRVGTLWSPESTPESAQEAIVRAAVVGMTEEQQETFRLIYGERLSYREAAEVLGIDVSSVRDRIATLKRIVTRALVSAADGDA